CRLHQGHSGTAAGAALALGAAPRDARAVHLLARRHAVAVRDFRLSLARGGNGARRARDQRAIPHAHVDTDRPGSRKRECGAAGRSLSRRGLVSRVVAARRYEPRGQGVPRVSDRGTRRAGVEPIHRRRGRDRWRGADQSVQHRRLRRRHPARGAHGRRRAARTDAPHADAAAEPDNFRLACCDTQPDRGDHRRALAGDRRGVTRALLPVAADVAARLAGTPLVSMLDVDGTLAPIAPRPEDAAVPPDTRRLLAALAAHIGVTVAFVSGRAAADVERLAGVRELSDAVQSTPGVLVEDKHWTASVHFRLAAPSIAPSLRDIVRQAADRHGLRVMEGKKVLEIRPNRDVNKGTAALQLAREILGERPGSVLYIGDDATDEDAFASLRAQMPSAVTARVTHDDAARTAAEFELEDTRAVSEFLRWLAAERGVPALGAS